MTLGFPNIYSSQPPPKFKKWVANDAYGSHLKSDFHICDVITQTEVNSTFVENNLLVGFGLFK